MSADVQDGNSNVDGGKLNGDTEDTIPLKDAENSLSKDDQSPSATIEINDQSTKEKRSKFIGSYNDALRTLEITEKSKKTFLILIALVILLFIVLVVLIALWPSIPSYLKYPTCNNKFCLSSSLQVTSWLDRKQNVCHSPYDWACGNFAQEFVDHELHGKFRGEWNHQNVFKFEEIAKINNFITRSLNNVTGSGVFVKELYSSCLNLDKIEESASMPYIRKVIRQLGGWRMVEDALSQWQQKKWTIQQTLPTLQNRFGISLFYKVHVIDRPSTPFGKIIAITDGDLGLPHKDLYAIDTNNKIVRFYKELLQNTLKLFDRSSEEARQFADVIYNYERRVVHDAFNTNRGDEGTGEVVRLGKLKMEFGSIALYDTINAMFPKTKDNTEIWIEDYEKLRAIARVVSSTDATVLNDLTVWSTLKRLFPFASKGIRSIWDEYQHDIYGVHTNEPVWYSCTSTVNQLVPVAIEVLKNEQISVHEMEYVEHLFTAVRDAVVDKIDKVVWIDTELSSFLIEKLRQSTLQIGVPVEILRDDTFLDRYYAEFFPQTSFIENFEVFWTFEKSLMAKELGEFEEADEILFNLFPTSRSHKDDVSYSVELNKIIIRSSVIKSSYFNTQYSHSMNFARVGIDLAQALIKATQTLSAHYSPQTSPLTYRGAARCLEFESPLAITPHEAEQNLLLEFSATNIATAAFDRLLTSIAKGRETPFGYISEIPRPPGLQEFNEKQLFDLVVLQKHCGITTGGYSAAKPFFEQQFPEEDTFHNVWPNLNDFDCSVKTFECNNVF